MTQMTGGGEDVKESRSTGMTQMTQMTKMTGVDGGSENLFWQKVEK